MKKIKIDSFEIYFSKKIGLKSIRLRLDKQGRILLTAPFLCSEKRACNFVFENRNWLHEQIKKQPSLKTFHSEQIISIVGKEYIISHEPNQKRGVFIENEKLCVCGNIEFLPRRVREFIKKQLLLYIQQKAYLFATQIQQKPNKITLRDTTSRWGSCSSHHNLSFCWKLALAPTFVIDYIIAHEVSHLKEMNHGSAFWETVALFNTEQAAAQIWLRRHGRELQSWK